MYGQKENSGYTPPSAMGKKEDYGGWVTVHQRVLADTIARPNQALDFPIGLIVSQNKNMGWTNILIKRGTSQISIPDTKIQAVFETLKSWE